MTVEGEHRYVLLSVGSSSYHRDGEHLRWWEIFDFLYDEYRADPTAAYVGFYLTYDFTQWLRTLPEERARMLLTTTGKGKRTRKSKAPTPWPVECTDPQGTVWEFDVLGMKRLKLRPKGESGWMYICDAGPFFQTSFVSAINPKKTTDVVTDEEWAIIQEGKSERATAILGPDMIRYNVTENLVLSRLMHQLDEGLCAMGLKLKRTQWFGPGQAAQAWLSTINSPTGEDVYRAIPSTFAHAARESYYGGWFETAYVGHIPGTSWQYDINSAYPYAIAQLPCLLHGRFAEGEGSPPDSASPYTLVSGVFGADMDAATGPVPYRDQHGIDRRSAVRGVYWLPEIEAARRAGLCAWYDEISYWWSYDPCDCIQPFFKIANLYERRLAVGKNTSQGKACKLVYNSAYGKMAQSVGQPKYANSVYASLITSATRTMILDAIATHPGPPTDLVMVATDGVTFRTPHPGLELDSLRLGAWDETRSDNLTVVMPGVYWDDAGRENVRQGGVLGLKTRGVNARAVARHMEEMDALFTEFALMEGRWRFPTMELFVDFQMTTPISALHRRKWFLAGRVSSTTREINSMPRKRDPFRPTMVDGAIWYPTFHLGGEGTSPDDHVVTSMPYSKTFGEEGSEDACVTPEGESDTALNGLLNGSLF